jgi:MoaA/NifB/PqqE/SkfB family radical SAM enzyme
LLEEMGEHLFLMEIHSWGEPLLNKQLPTFVRKAQAKKIETHMHTNLSLPLSDERIEDILGAGSISCSHPWTASPRRPTRGFASAVI